jgi:hypothetical protein
MGSSATIQAMNKWAEYFLNHFLFNKNMRAKVTVINPNVTAVYNLSILNTKIPAENIIIVKCDQLPHLIFDSLGK